MPATPDHPASPAPAPPADQLDFARAALDAEADAIAALPLTDAFHHAVDLLLHATANHGQLVVTGLGKSGLIAQKLAATFASTATPAHFLHPVEALHGDIGKVRRGDAVLLLSYSGGTDELITLAELLRQDQTPLISITASTTSALGKLATVALPLGDIAEACPHGLAPTASTAAMLALGDALALTVAHRRGFSPDDFAKRHPAGGLGRQLMPVTHAMRFKIGDNVAPVPADTPAADAYAAAEQHATDRGLRRPGALLITAPDGTLAGILTDGDLRSALIAHGPQAWSAPVDQLMTNNPTTLPDTALVRDAVHIVRTRRFDEIPIINDQKHPVGLIDVQDLAALKVIEG